MGPSDAFAHFPRRVLSLWSAPRRRARKRTSSACARWAWARRARDGHRRRGAADAIRPACRWCGSTSIEGITASRSRPSAITSTLGGRLDHLARRRRPVLLASSTRRPSSASTGRAAPSTRRQITRTGHAAGLSLSMPLGDHFILGATAKYLHYRHHGAVADGHVPIHLTLDTVNGVTFDVGMIVRSASVSTSALIGYNLWDHGSRESPLSLGIGLAVRAAADAEHQLRHGHQLHGYQNYKLDSDDRQGQPRSDDDRAARPRHRVGRRAARCRSAPASSTTRACRRPT